MTRKMGIVAALAVAAARCLVHPPSNPALDPVVILAALWVAVALAPRERAADAAVVAASVLLLFAYAWVQVPFALELLKLTL